MQKILISTPLKGGLSSEYVAALIRLLLWRQNKYVFQWAITKGTSVAMARCELAQVALKNGFDRWVQWDKDVVNPNSANMLAMFERLLSHDVDIVAAPYVGHNVNSKFHGATDATEIGENGLMEMEQVPIGMSVIKVPVLRTIMERHPHFRYMMKQTDDAIARPEMFEFFPNGVVGPNSAYGKMGRLRGIVSKNPTVASIELMQEISTILYDADYSANYMLGEDFYFCMLARTAGIKLHIDNNLIMPHLSEVYLPIKNQHLLAALGEEWRWNEGVKAEEVVPLLEKLAPNFSDTIQ